LANRTGKKRIMFAGMAAKGYTQSMGYTDYPFSFALAIIVSLPTILLYVFLQRYFVEGMQGFAIKG